MRLVKATLRLSGTVQQSSTNHPRYPLFVLNVNFPAQVKAALTTTLTPPTLAPSPNSVLGATLATKFLRNTRSSSKVAILLLISVATEVETLVAVGNSIQPMHSRMVNVRIGGL